jgi:probable HAF family extracellular repeat protein
MQQLQRDKREWSGPMVLKTTRITVETDTLMVIRRAKAVFAWCPDCHAEVNAITLDSDGVTQAATAAHLQRWLETGKLHFWQQANEAAQICVPSLLQCVEWEENQRFSSSRQNPPHQPRRKGMKLTRSIANLFRLTGFALVLALFTGAVWAQQHPILQTGGPGSVRYAVIDLGTLGGSFGLAFGINDRGQVDGFANLPGDTAQHAFVFAKGVMTDLGTLGGPNSASYEGPSEALQAAGLAETSTPDPTGEDFCGYGDNLICLAFSWQNGVMTPLDTLGGYNAQGSGINDRGQIAGYAENRTPDPNCPAPQVLQFKPVVWTNGRIQALPTYLGDPEGGAFWINNEGELVGASGDCAPFDIRYGLPLAPKHALLWRKGLPPINLGNLGGQINNAAFAINDHEQVVGTSDLSGDQFQHAFLWQKGVMSDLGTLPGDVISVGCGINNRGQVTGVSIDPSGNPRAYLWQNGVMTDLNNLIPSDSPLHLMHGFSINSSGEIVGFAYNTETGNVDAYVAVPVNSGGGAGSASSPASGGARVTLPESARQQFQQWLRFGRFGYQPPDPCGKDSKLGPDCKAN